jgi:kynureninase
VLARLEQDAFLLDFREPDILRIAPVPLYNGFEDVWCFVDGLRTALEATA